MSSGDEKIGNITLQSMSDLPVDRLRYVMKYNSMSGIGQTGSFTEKGLCDLLLCIIY